MARIGLSEHFSTRGTKADSLNGLFNDSEGEGKILEKAFKSFSIGTFIKPTVIKSKAGLT